MIRQAAIRRLNPLSGVYLAQLWRDGSNTGLRHMRGSNRREIWVMDVFTTELYRGNPAAVVFDALGIDDDTMQAIAREMNLSETAFILPPVDAEAHYSVRLFTPRSELPFAGHPTIAVAAAFVERDPQLAGNLPGTLRQECGIGIIHIDVSLAEGGGYEFTMTQAAPLWRDVPLARQEAAEMLGCPADDVCELPSQVVSTGVPWLIIPLRSPAAVVAIRPDLKAIERFCYEHRAVGVTTYAIGASGQQKWIKVRTFAPGQGVTEDPVCGSGNGSVAAYIAATAQFGGPSFDYVAHQGSEVSRPGRVLVHCSPGSEGLRVRVGGRAVNVLQGHILV